MTKRRTAPLLLALLVLALPAWAGNGIWTPLGPDGGNVIELAVDPSNPAVVYAGTPYSAFKSTDGGATWRPASAGMASGTQVATIAVDPLRPETVFAVTGQRLFKSVDAGLTWTAASAGLPQGAIADLLFAPAGGRRAPRRLWAATSQGLFATADGGATWKRTGKGLPALPALSLAIHPRTSTLYAGLIDGRVFCSDNRGATWYSTGRGIPSHQPVYELAVDPNDPGFVIASTGEAVYRTQRGRRWVPIETGARLRFDVLAFDPSGDRIYLGGIGGLLVSTDRGATWTRVDVPDRDVLALAVTADVLYAGTQGYLRQGGVFRSLDGGESWTLGRGLSTLLIWNVIASPGHLYANTLGLLGIFRSDDRGATWRNLDLGVLPDAAQFLAYDPRNPALVYATSHAHDLLRSGDHGDSWIGIPRGDDWILQDLAFDLNGPEALWAGGPAGLFHSEDGGRTWQRQAVDEEFHLWDVEPHPLAPDVVYALGDTPIGALSHLAPRLERTRDGGLTWESLPIDPLERGGQTVDLALDPEDIDTLYAATRGGLFRSADGGQSWQPVPELSGPANAVATAPGGVVYASSRGEVLRSADRGETWTSIRRGLGGWRTVSSLAVDPEDPRRVYAGTFGGGVYTWTEPAE